MEFMIKSLSENEASQLFSNPSRRYESMTWTNLKSLMGKNKMVFDFYEVHSGVYRINQDSFMKYVEKHKIDGHLKERICTRTFDYHWDISWLEPMNKLFKIQQESTIH